MNEHEIERLSAAFNVLRPDWPARSLATLLRRPELVHRPRRDVAVALAWIACESATANPGRVLEAGPWWKAAALDSGPPTWTPPKAHEACRVCNRHLGACICEQPTTRPIVGTEPTDSYRAAKKLLGRSEA